MKITRSEIGAITPRPQADSRPQSTATSAVRSAQTTQLSGQVKELSQAKEMLANLPDVDMDKVAAIRQAIADGQLSLDTEALSSAILDMHRR